MAIATKNSSHSEKPVWFITGGSTGFGRQIATHLLVNNAGIGYFAAVEESDENEVRKMFDVNVFGLCRMIHVVLPGMRKRRLRRRDCEAGRTAC
jgi:short-subunit dehydrogenase